MDCLGIAETRRTAQLNGEQVVPHRLPNPRQVLLPPSRTDNCIKNHFYSKLRKILRKLNTVIHTHLRKEYRQINIGTLYKIVEAT